MLLSKLQVFLDLLNGSLYMLEIRFAHSKCKALFRNWIDSNSNLFLVWERWIDLVTWIILSHLVVGSTSDGMCSYIEKARLTFTNLRHLWHRCDMQFLILDRIYTVAPRSSLLYGSKTLVDSSCAKTFAIWALLFSDYWSVAVKWIKHLSLKRSVSNPRSTGHFRCRRQLVAWLTTTSDLMRFDVLRHSAYSGT